MPEKSLTDRFVASVRSTTRENYFDSKTSGLVLLMTPTGVKTWKFVYRPVAKPHWLTLGSYPAVSVADARALALDNRHALEVEGRDPAAERRVRTGDRQASASRRPGRLRVRRLRELYETFAKGNKKTWKDDVTKIPKHLLPPRGEMSLRSITRVHVHELLEALGTGHDRRRQSKGW
jgi:hypothetical protein